MRAMMVTIFMQRWWLDRAGIPISKFLVERNYRDRIARMCATDDACRIPKEIISTRERFGYPQRTTDVCEIRPRKDKRGVDLVSDVLPFGRL